MDSNEMKDKMEVSRLEAVGRRQFLKGAAGAAMVASSIGLSPLLGSSPAVAAPVSGLKLQASSLSNITHYVGIRHVGAFNDVNSTWARLTQFALQQGISGPNVISFADVCPCADLTAPTLPDTSIKAFYDCLLYTSPSPRD